VDHICDIKNINDKESNRLSLFREDMEKLANGEWLANIIIDFLRGN
jgi:Ulp1 family protease